MKTLDFNDITFKIGQNKTENWSLLNENNLYTWFHLNSFPSCYVICCTENITLELIEYGAKLCKENTKYRNLKNLKINYTTIKNLKKAQQEGAVFYISKKQVKNINI